MKRIVFVVFFYCIRFWANGQEFLTKLYFQDAKMHYDTLIVGYDQNATDSIDQSLGEKDINGTPFDSVFEVRATDQYKLAYKGIPYLVKTQIVKKGCEESKFPFVTAILVKCKHYPLKIKWDKVLFDDPCRKYSLITDWNPGGWFDAGGGQGPYYLKDIDSVAFPYINESYNYEYNSTLPDTIRLLYFTIASKQNFTANSELKSLANFVSVYPTVVNNQLFIKANTKHQVEYISIVDLAGRIFSPKIKSDAINVSLFNPGIYVVHVKIKEVNTIFTSKIIKL